MTPNSTTHHPAGIVCPKCRHVNPVWRVTCERCQARLPRPEDHPPPSARRVERPGYITGWAILFGAYLVLTALDYGWALASSTAINTADLLVLAVVGVTIFLALVIIAGVWQMHAWARIPAMLLHAALIVFILATLLAAPGPDRSDLSAEERRRAEGDRALDVCSGLFWIGFNAAYLYWFAAHKDKFAPPE